MQDLTSPIALNCQFPLSLTRAAIALETSKASLAVFAHCESIPRSRVDGKRCATPLWRAPSERYRVVPTWCPDGATWALCLVCDSLAFPVPVTGYLC